jgi:glycolate oxidase iron-sulfur subunit
MEKLMQNLEEETDSCINCGFCESACPTLPASGFRASIGARGRVDMGKALIHEYKETGKISLKINESFYSCLDCFACVQVCPAGVNAGKVSQIGKEIVVKETTNSGSSNNPVAEMIVNITMKHMNPLGVGKQCSGWAKNLSFDNNSEFLLYTGHMYQLMAYNKKLQTMEKRMGENLAESMSKLLSKHTELSRFMRFFKDKELNIEMNKYLQNIYHLLKKTGLDFKYLGKEEPYPGTFIYDLGYLENFKAYSNYIIDLFHKHKIRKIITVDPHTYDLLKNIMPKYNENFDFEVYHYLELIKDLNFSNSGEKVTYHEPCHFVLRDNALNLPRDMLEQTSHLTMPVRSGKKVFCCGGPTELLYGNLSEKVSNIRYEQLRQTGSNKIITACPICLTNLKKDSNVIDISEKLLSSLNTSQPS